MRILAIALLLVSAGWSAGCGDDNDETGIPCIADDKCQPECARDPDCRNGDGGEAGGATGSGGTGGNAEPLDLDDAGGHDPACPTGLFSGDVQVRDFHDLDQVAECTAIAGDLVVQDAFISDFHGLSGVTSIGGSLILSNNRHLETLAGLGALVTVGRDVIINYNPKLGDISDLSALSGVGGDLRIRANTALAALEGLGNLRSVGGDLYIRANTQLASLEGLGSADSVVAVDGALQIGQNSALPTCQATSLRVHVSESSQICENKKDDCGSDSCPELW